MDIIATTDKGMYILEDVKELAVTSETGLSIKQYDGPEWGWTVTETEEETK